MSWWRRWLGPCFAFRQGPDAAGSVAVGEDQLNAPCDHPRALVLSPGGLRHRGVAGCPAAVGGLQRSNRCPTGIVEGSSRSQVRLAVGAGDPIARGIASGDDGSCRGWAAQPPWRVSCLGLPLPGLSWRLCPELWPLRQKPSAHQPRPGPGWERASPSGLGHAVVVFPRDGGRGCRIQAAPWLVFKAHHGISHGVASAGFRSPARSCRSHLCRCHPYRRHRRGGRRAGAARPPGRLAAAGENPAGGGGAGLCLVAVPGDVGAPLPRQPLSGPEHSPRGDPRLGAAAHSGRGSTGRWPTIPSSQPLMIR